MNCPPANFPRFLTSCILVCTLSASLPGWAKDVRVAGMGVRKCAEWTAWKTSQNGEARAMTVEWAQGFLAGHNVYARTGEAQSSVFADTKTVAALLDNFCLKNPEERLVAGIIDITQSLGGARINIAPRPPAAPQLPKSDKEPRET